jgi:hypothetical protein
MTTASHWSGLEQSICRLLETERKSGKREILLAQIAAYARAVVSEARHTATDPPTADQTESALSWLERPVFICGHHRSGTTLLQQLLDGHPELLVLPSEGTYFTSFRYAARVDPPSQDIDRFAVDWIERLVDPNHAPHFKLGLSGTSGNPSLLFAQRLLAWRIALRDARPAKAAFAPLLALAAAYRDVTAPNSTPRLWVEKTPLNEHHVGRFAGFGDARFIQMVRSPGSTLTSLRAAFGDAPFDAPRHVGAIARSLRRASGNLRRLGNRYLVVRYEDLSQDPAREMQRVRDFLEISENPSLLLPTVGGRAARSNSSFEPGPCGAIRTAQNVPTLSAADADLVGALAATPARSLGYDVKNAAVLSRVAARLREAPSTALHGMFDLLGYLKLRR